MENYFNNVQRIPSIFEIATAFEDGKNGENTTGCFIPGDSISHNKEKTDYFISDNGKKNELFRFFNNYGQDGIIINVGPDFEDLYK